MKEDCCANSGSLPKAPEAAASERCCEFHPLTVCGPAKCPQCGGLGKPVKRMTLGALLKPDRRAKIPAGDEFCFCRNATCDVVYFLPGKALFRKEDVSVQVGIKEPKDPTVPVCYCFGWTPDKIRAEIEATGKSTVLDQIKAEVKAGNCYCEVTNPEGSCCLGNVAKAVKQITETLARGFFQQEGLEMKHLIVLALVFFLLLPGLGYGTERSQDIVVEPQQVIVQVKGVVCSFCAYGTEKNLSKLRFLNHSLFGNGVLMDIFTNRITLALAPNEPLDLAGVYQAIKKGGYDPLAVYLRLSGPVEKRGDRYLLNTENGQVFELTGSEVGKLLGKQAVEVQAHLDAAEIPSLREGEPLRVTLDKVWVSR